MFVILVFDMYYYIFLRGIVNISLHQFVSHSRANCQRNIMNEKMI